MLLAHHSLYLTIMQTKLYPDNQRSSKRKLERSEAFRLNDIKFNGLILLLNFIFIFTFTLSLWYGCNLRIHLPTGYPHYSISLSSSLNSHLENCCFEPIDETFLSTGILSGTSSPGWKEICLPIWLSRDHNRTQTTLPACSPTMLLQI